MPVVTGPYTANIDGDLALLSRADLAYRMETPGSFPALDESLRNFNTDAARNRLTDQLDSLTHPATLLAEGVGRAFSAS